MILPDYSKFLDKPGMLSYIESEWLRNKQLHDQQAKIVNGVLLDKNLTSFLEVGCSTGNTASRVGNQANYTGIDGHLPSIFMAIMKNPGMRFVFGDIRAFETYRHDLVFTFAVLKHFGLHEWQGIFSHILSLGSYALFDMPIAEEVKDDGEEHHHVWMTLDVLKEHIRAAGHEYVSTFFANTVEPVFLTRKIVD